VHITPRHLHEVRTGLTIAMLATDRLARRRDDPEVNDAVRLLHQSFWRILAAVEEWNSLADVPPQMLHIGPPPEDGRAAQSLLGSDNTAVDGDALQALRTDFAAIMEELRQLRPAKDYLAERTILYGMLQRLSDEVSTALTTERMRDGQKEHTRP